MILKNPSYKHLKSRVILERSDNRLKVKYWVRLMVLLIVVSMFLPWTQNIRSRGTVTTRLQNERPQAIHSPIPGRIEKWYVKEGDMLKKGDTILKLSEIKTEYLDPSLVSRTKEMSQAKREMLQTYESNVRVLNQQISALEKARDAKLSQIEIKLKQLEAKIRTEETELSAATNEVNLLKDQYERQQKLFDNGLSSQTQLQQRNQAYQNGIAKKTASENKLYQSIQEQINLSLERNSVSQDYLEKISKASAEQYKIKGSLAEGRGDLAKLENQITNYVIRNGMYAILAPQDGQLIQAKKSGIGELLKEGENIASIVPLENQYAVEMFVRPVDLPLINPGQKVRFMFDGYPAIVFSGWPENSYGTFGGVVQSVEKNIQDNHLFRVLVIPDTSSKKWPNQLSLGSGAQCIALLKDVPVWYELWRTINGFPPDFYDQQQNDKYEKNEKK